MLANVRCFFSGFSSPSPPLLLARGWERFGRRGILKFFSFYHWLAPYWLQRDSSPRLIVCSAFSSPSLGAWDPQPLFWARRRCALPRGSGPRGWQERKVAAGSLPDMLLLDFSSVVVGMLGIDRKLYGFESASLACLSFDSCESG